MTGRAIRILVADDSETMRSAIALLLAEEPDFEVVGQAKDGHEAVQMAIELSPDVITMDVQMPRMDGLEAITAIMTEAPSRILVVCAAQPRDDRSLDLTFRAIEAGALELMPKPDGPGSGGLRAWGKRLREAVRLMAEIPVVRRRRTGSPATAPRNPVGRIDGVGIVASTGGPPALAAILAAMPASLPIPILVAQHMAHGFSDGLVRWFSHATPMAVRIAVEGTPPMRGTVYLPPDGLDLELDEKGLIRLRPNLGGNWPNGNLLLSSLARVYGERAAGVVLTGMGEDGAQGLLAIRRAHGTTMVQDEGTSIVFGMPLAAIHLDAASWVLPVQSIAPTLLQLSGIDLRAKA